MSGGLDVTAASAEELLRAMSEAAIDAVMLHTHGRILACNDAACILFGYPADEMLGHSVLEFASPDYVDHVRANYESELDMTYQAWGVRKDGTRFRAEVRSRNVPCGGTTVRAAVLRDLTQRDIADRQHAATISLLRATLDSTADGIIVVDRSGHITLYNERFLSIWGIAAPVLGEDDDRVIARVERQLIDPTSFRARIAALYEAPETESIDILEFRDGRLIERYSRPQRIGTTIIGRVWSFREVTAQRRAERTLELAVQMRDEFLAIASHELFTPITSLGLAIRGLREMAPTAPAAEVDGRRDRLFANAQRQVERLTRLVQELLDVAKIDGGRLDLQLADIDLRDVARDAIDRFALELERGQIKISLDAPAPVGGRWDRSRLDQVVTNLLANAIKFGKGRPIELTARTEGSHAELVVRDHGIGIADDQQTHIFDRFQRAVSSRHFAGLGLGLFITRQLVEAHGGTLSLVSRQGEGATFTVKLPRVAPQGDVRE